MKLPHPPASPVSTARAISVRVRPRLLLTLGAAALAAAGPGCGGSGASLTVDVTVPEGVVPEVIVNGPRAYTATIHGTTTLEDVPPGDYTVKITDRRARLAHPVVDTVFAGTVIGSPAHVDEKGTGSVTVQFDREPGTGRVWIPMSLEDRVISMTGDELSTDGAPSVELDVGAKAAPQAIAVDARGNLWVSLRGADQVVRLNATDLGVSGHPTPSATLKTAGPEGLAFADGGDLWVASTEKKRLSRYANALTVPTLRMEMPIAGTPHGIAFDAKGNMLVTTTEPAALLVFTKESLDTPTPVAARTVKGPTSRLVKPSTIALDANGGVWVTSGGEAVRFDGAALSAIIGEIDLAPTSSLMPSANGSLDGVAFDNGGTAWFSAFGGKDYELAKATAMGDASPALNGARSLHVHGAHAVGLGSPAFVPPSRVSPIRR